ncbi:MAG: phosphoribosylformylglycinamidine cyclo-ligase [Pseudomonadota bacterium]
MTDAYKKAGVDIDAGNKFVENIKPLIRATQRRGAIGKLGGFGGLFALDTADMREPVLVSGTDGVGSKLKLAIEMGVLDTIGIDLVAMCVNDIACSGAEPLFFLDYFATSKLKPDEHTAIVAGIANACRQTKCALIGGETAEMPDIYAPGDFDLAGFAVGIVDRAKIIDGSEISAGNSIIGFASSGFHSNGFALVRRIVRDAGLSLSDTYDGLARPLGQCLLEPTRLYSPMIAQLKRAFHIKGIAHITGGGFWDNIPRILPAGVQAAITKESWSIPPLFRLFEQHGRIDEAEMLRVFNCGIGMVFVVPADEAKELIDAAAAQGESAAIIGTTRQRPKGSPAIVIE